MGRARGRWLLGALAGMGALALGSAGARAASDGRVPPGLTPRMVVDARGVTVGLQVQGAAAVATVWRREGGLDVLLQVAGDRIFRGSNSLGFEAPDCQGDPWILSEVTPGSNPFFTESGIDPANVLHVGQGSSETRSIASHARPGGAPPCVNVTVSDQIVRPAVPLLDLAVFTAPFQIR